MSVNELVASKMENIKRIFQASKELASNIQHMDELILCLNKTENEFLSLAFEGASMELALQDIVKNNSLKNWNTFLQRSLIHAPQIHVGLGWVIAQEKFSDSYLNEIDSNMRFRVWDGCGYFDGIFRQRQTVKNQTRLEYIPEIDWNDYDQGLGRSLWYTCKGDESKLPDLIAHFPPGRHSDLWRGIGIACAYVGGCDEERLKNLVTLSGENKTQLKIGAEWVLKSREQSGCTTEDTELTYKIFSS